MIYSHADVNKAVIDRRLQPATATWELLYILLRVAVYDTALCANMLI